MNIECFKNHNIPYLRLVASQGLKKVEGRTVHRRHTVLYLGPLSRHDDGKPNFLSRLRESFRNGKPLLAELEPFVDDKTVAEINIKFRSDDAKCIGESKLMAAIILDPIFNFLGLGELFASIKHDLKIRYDLAGIVRLLTYGRLLNPASKIATMEQNDKYYHPLVSSTNDDNVYDTLSIIDQNASKIFQRMNTCITRGIGRSTKVVFYDVTNFFFEIQNPDEDVIDEEGNVVDKGLRKMGVSKENRKQPIAQVGFFLDEHGIPISFGTFPGNTLDHNTLRPAMTKTIDTLGLSRFLLVADRGMYSGTNMCHVLDAGNGYIVSKSLRKSSHEDIAWALNQDGYNNPNADFRYKSRIIERTVLDENKKNRKIKEKVVVYWSKRFYEREQHENASFLNFVEKLKANPAGFRITTAQSYSLRKFLKKDVFNKENGEILDGTKLVAMIDNDKLNAFNELFGYYQIVTSELDMPDREIIEKYHGLTQIEDQFREMKSTLETRPMYVRTKEHINAHLMICFIALTMMRLIQHKTKMVLGADFGKDLNWTYGIPGARISTALREWQVTELPGEYYQMLNTSNDDISTLFKAFGINIPVKIYTKGDIRELKSTINLS